ncbi:hypothetical protein ABIB25_004833 [Nakamurella sp. UYEF19]|uniref:cellulase family glycosylhydrolase n=1 Tax=Nakamurella sp. UYEF19 TaxID=1756392 RepID=UPI00339B328B
MATLILLAVLALVMSSCTSGGPTTTTITASTSGQGSTAAATSGVTSTTRSIEANSGFVTRSGRELMLDGQRFRFVGANLYDAAATDIYSCNPGKRLSDADLLTTLRYLHDQGGATVLRFWAYQTYTQGGTYFGGIDRVIAAAKEVGMKVLPVLEDGPGNCTTIEPASSKASYKGDTWYSEGYKVPYGNAALSYRDYVKTVVAHYADEPTILGWSMMNEADTAARDPFDRPILVDFATDIAAQIRSVDTRHLLTVGTQSNGALGASGPDFTAVYGLSQIDLAEVHDWGYWGSDQSPMPGGSGSTPPAADSAECVQRNAKVGCSFALAVGLDKPLFVGEAGIFGRTAEERTARAPLLRAKMDAAFAAGAIGYVLWSVTTEITDGYDILISDGDPLFAEMSAVARNNP